MRILQVMFVALVMLTAATAVSRSHAESHFATAFTAADPIPLCPTLRCPAQPSPTK